MPMQETGIRKAVWGTLAGLGLQLALGAPFLVHHPFSYLERAFEFSRVFMYKWSVNWQFLPETLFLSKQFAVLLLIIQLRLLWSLANYTWYVLIDISSKRKDYKPELSSCAGLKVWEVCMGLGSHLLTSRKGMKTKMLEMDSSRMTFCTSSSCLTL